MDPFERLHPGLQYHFGEHPAVERTSSYPGRCGRADPVRSGHPRAGTDRRRQDRAAVSPPVTDGVRRVAGRLDPLHLPTASPTQQPDTADQWLLPVAGAQCRGLARRRQPEPTPAHPYRPARHSAHHTGIPGSDAGLDESRSAPAVFRVAGRGGRWIHAFAGDDRGWHLLGVLERLSRVAGREVQRIGLSATVGNPQELLDWLQGSFAQQAKTSSPQKLAAAHNPGDHGRFRRVAAQRRNGDFFAASGRKRLVFVESRRRAEELGAALRDRGVRPTSRIPRCRHPSGVAPKRPSPTLATPSSSRPPPWSSVSTSAISIESSRLDRPARSPRSCSGSAEPGGAPAPAATACSFASTTRACCSRLGCSNGGQTAGSNQSNRQPTPPHRCPAIDGALPARTPHHHECPRGMVGRTASVR